MTEFDWIGIMQAFILLIVLFGVFYAVYVRINKPKDDE